MQRYFHPVCDISVLLTSIPESTKSVYAPSSKAKREISSVDHSPRGDTDTSVFLGRLLWHRNPWHSRQRTSPLRMSIVVVEACSVQFYAGRLFLQTSALPSTMFRVFFIIPIIFVIWRPSPSY